MHASSAKLTTALGLILLAGNAAADQLLVLEKDNLQLAIVDPTKLTVLTRVASGPDPHEVVVSADGRIAYISNYGGEGSDLHMISCVDLLTRKALPPIDLGALHSAHGLDFSGGKLYFTAETNKLIGRYDPATSKIDWVLGTGQDRTHMVMVAQNGERLYTTNARSGSVSIIESTLGPRQITVWNSTVVPAGRGAEGFDVSPDGKQLWAGNSQDATVTVIDLGTKKAVETFAVPVRGANRLKFTPDGKHVLVSALGNFATREPDHANLIVIDTATHKTVKALDLGGGAAGLLIPPKGDVAYVAVSGGGKVAVVDLKTFEVRGRIEPLGQPDGLAWTSGR